MNDVNGLGPGYGGTLAAPIWKQFMQGASDGYCGDFTPPTEYWHGVEYFGKHAVSAYVPPVVTTSTSTTTTGASTNATGGSGLTTPGGVTTSPANQPANPSDGSGGTPPAAGGVN
jgi:membrane peptidoglycan carboxypeptidase